LAYKPSPDIYRFRDIPDIKRQTKLPGSAAKLLREPDGYFLKGVADAFHPR